jgi:hypothetical protein
MRARPLFARRLPAALLLLGGQAALVPLDAQRPRGRLPFMDVTVEQVAKLNPVAKLQREGKKLQLTEAQATRLDSVAAGLGREIEPFLARIDSLTPRRGGGRERPAGEREGDPPDRDPMDSPLARRWNAIAQIRLRYEAAMLTVLRFLTDAQQPIAIDLVEKEQARMEALTMSPMDGGRP